LETDDARAETAAALAEVLRCGAGLEDEGDYAEFAFSIRFSNAQPLNEVVRQWHRDNRLIPLQTDQEGIFVAMVLDFGETGLIAAGETTAKSGRFAGYLMIVQDFLRVWGPVADSVQKLRDELREKLGLGLDEGTVTRGPILFEDVVSEALLFPLGV